MEDLEAPALKINGAEKRRLSVEDVATPPKKAKLFSAPDLRKQLQTNQKASALQEFLTIIKNGSDPKCVLAYLEKGGSCLEILQVMENDPTVSPIVIFDVVNQILGQIGTNYQQYEKFAYDSCRYLLNNYFKLIDKMLKIESSPKERLVSLELLTTIVTFWTSLAKDILLHLNLDRNLAKTIEDNKDVRRAFINFIVALLVNGNFPTLSVLLKKHELVTSIISGLKFDPAEIVVTVMTAMKNHILENPLVLKTVKMKTFHTEIIKNIINLYNWKGPSGIKFKKKQSAIVEANTLDRAKAIEAVHSFLLVLCSSKHGVIFRDPLVGLGTKNHNSLMRSVLESLECPWEHSYACDLITKMCGACPDLTKTMWSKLTPFLEPRFSPKWVSAMEFAGKLAAEFKPVCLDPYIGELNLQQVVQIVSNLVMPLPVLKSVVLEENLYECQPVKLQVVKLLHWIAATVCDYVTKSQDWANIESKSLSAALSGTVNQNFPEAKSVLENWDRDDNLTTEYLETVFDLFEVYQILAPHLLDSLSITLNIREFLAKISHLNANLQVKAVKFFLDLEPAIFDSKNDLFETAMTLSFRYYHETRASGALKLLNGLLTNCQVFVGFKNETNFWIDAILNCKTCDDEILTMLVGSIKVSDGYYRELYQIPYSNFGPLVLAFRDQLKGKLVTKSIKNYLNFVIVNLVHLQNNLGPLREVVSEFLPEDLKSYLENWENGAVGELKKNKNCLELFRKFSKNFFDGDFDENFELDAYPDLKLNLLQTAIFYLAKLAKSGSLEKKHVESCEKFIKLLPSESFREDGRLLQAIFNNSSILNNITLSPSTSLCTEFLIKTVDHLKSIQCDFGKYLENFRSKIILIIKKNLKKPPKSPISVEVLEVIGLNYEDCQKILTAIASSSQNVFFNTAATYCLSQLAKLANQNPSLSPLSDDVISELSRHFVPLIETQVVDLPKFSSSFLAYLQVFPRSAASFEIESFSALLTLKEFNMHNLGLCEFLLEKRPEFFENFEANLAEICEKRGFLLSLLSVVQKQKPELCREIFEKFEPSILKALQKPHKAGQHFHNYYKPLGDLITNFMEPKNFGAKVEKFETTEIFHVYLLKKICDKIEKTSKNLSNIVMTFVHLLNALLKQKTVASEKIRDVSEIFYELLLSLDGHELKNVSNNESFKLLCKLCLFKFFVTGEDVLLKILSKLADLCFKEEEAKLVLDMLLSHSDFLDLALGEGEKEELIQLWALLCTKWPQFMEPNHVPILLAAYTGTQTRTNKTIVNLLEKYQLRAEQTNFYDFKPFLWGQQAATFYSARFDIQKALYRQPKMSDILDNLDVSTVKATITHPSSPNSYDLKFFLPIFAHILSPERPVATYFFTRSGALALTIAGLGHEDKNVRQAAIFVLSRFHSHLESKQNGKDNLLWIRFIEAICKGTAQIKDFRLNSFSTIFLAKTALVLSQPNHVMYTSLTLYLTSRDTLDFSTIPELYTFLHMSDVHHRECRTFILEILRDGLRCEKDFLTLMKTMAFKLISELCLSCVSDFDTKFLILEVFDACCKLPLGVKVLCGSASFLSQIFGITKANLGKDDKGVGALLGKVLDILLKIVQGEINKHCCFMVHLSLKALLEDSCFSLLTNENVEVFYKILDVIVKRFPEFSLK